MKSIKYFKSKNKEVYMCVFFENGLIEKMMSVCKDTEGSSGVIVTTNEETIKISICSEEAERLEEFEYVNRMKRVSGIIEEISMEWYGIIVLNNRN